MKRLRFREYIMRHQQAGHPHPLFPLETNEQLGPYNLKSQFS